MSISNGGLLFEIVPFIAVLVFTTAALTLSTARDLSRKETSNPRLTVDFNCLETHPNEATA
jgi:hypothetical protein